MNENMIDAFLKTPKLYNVAVSPDMKWVVWVWYNIGPNADVYIAPLDSTLADDALLPRKLTDFKQDTAIMSWTNDSKFIVVGHDYDGDERTRLYKVNVETGESIPLTEEHPEYFMRGGQITPDNKYLIYGANYDFQTKEEIEPTLVYKHDLETGERKVLVRPTKPAYIRPTLNIQGTHIIYPRNDLDAKGEQIWLIDIEGSVDKEILNFGDTVKVSASWHPNGEQIVFVVEAETYRKVGLYSISTGDTKWLIDDASRNIEAAGVRRGQDKCVIVETVEAVDRVTLLDLETLEETSFADFQTLLPVVKLPDGTWLSKYYNSAQPTDLVVHTPTEIIRTVTDVFSKVEYKAEDLPKAENYKWKSVDGLEIQGWLYKPKTKAIGTVVLVHGGPTAHSEDICDTDIQCFVSAGFNVLDPNYRGSSGFGLTFQESIKEEGWGGKEQDDILYGIKSLINDGIAEKGKVGIMGTSYGGYSAWFAITHFPREFVAAAIPICGMTDLVVDYETTRPDLRGYSEEMMGGSPTDVPERYKKGSPIYYIKDIAGDLLIVQGAKDPNVSLENVKAVEIALKENNIKYETMIFEDEGHGILKPGNQKTLIMKCVEFYKKAFGI